MIIPRHKICDICGEEVGINKRYFIIKSKNYIVCYAGECSDNQKHHICEDCMYEFEKYLHSKLRNKKKETTFDDYLKEQLKDPEFSKEWEKLCNEDAQKGDAE